MPSTRPRGFMLDYNPAARTEKLIADVQDVLAQYVPTYGPMTIRQTFYRLVPTVAFPKTENDYKRLVEPSATRAAPALSLSTDIATTGTPLRSRRPGFSRQFP